MTTPDWWNRASLLTFLFSTSILVTSGIANAGPNERAKIQLDLTADTITNSCAHKPSCAQIVTDGRLLPSVYYAYLLVTDGDAAAGVGGFQCGIEYDGAAGSGVEIYYRIRWRRGFRGRDLFLDPFALTRKRRRQGGPPQETATGSWNGGTNCQMYEPGGGGTGVVATAGYFYVGAYSRDGLDITVRADDGIASVTDCSGVTNVIQGGDIIGIGVLGSVGFSADQSLPGFNPCGHCVVGAQ